MTSIKSINRGGIYYIIASPSVGHEQQGNRPAIVISNNLGNKYSPIAEIVYLTTKCKTHLKTHVAIHSCKRKSIALCEQVTTVDRSRISDYVGQASEKEMREINQAIKISLGMEEENMRNELTMIESELVPVYETSTGEKVVYGTELHKVLEVKSKFADWVKNRFKECDVLENEEYDSFSKILEKGGRPTIEYIIKLDTAKEMAMLERNEKGKQVRRYFIKVEKKYKENPYKNISTEMKALLMHDEKLVKIENRIDKLEYDIPLYGSEADELSSHVKRKGVAVLGGKRTNAYKDTNIRSKVYRDIYNQIKREFDIYGEDGKPKSYKALKRKYLADAHELVDAYEVPFCLAELIDYANSQINLEIA